MDNTTAYANENIIPFDDTYILYDPNDPISFLSAYFSLLPILILSFYLSWFIITRELEACIMAAGQLSNEIFNNIIKNIIKQTRPYHNYFGESFQQNTLRSGYGMPSAHSQFMGFLTLYLSLRYIYNWNNLSAFWKFLGISFITILGGCVCFSRLYLKYHSFNQVLVGWTLGTLTGSSYYLLVGIIREIGIIDWVLTWPIMKWLYVKDSWNLAPSTLKEDYQIYLQKKSGKYTKKTE
ncbi:dolichyldiphosphatase NDAI_0D04020 [Naumovozyma dairenensis CBS 421]|uniref:Phosphatidic acid phosphatase type 2/haloperoxidase domain-containing protein n=1 Tax=Naumovozyma dairenensis (strain ATCC 10597 / BCRC 20456 / CBS 421 / NBRC 0211 / NRRL Y-12639) TaxID=1071378 RepID=G0WAA5_NAUDC|nr:hypothetical protein NDAI_0D04020 [Naumovozyma dairenensis CBS 421]CCD24716.1 hypothetical protein NDAI_0D04020 [Naumovozyma dairenensis CBS 421]